jgi:SAM-dependent methyltransferase
MTVFRDHFSGLAERFQRVIATDASRSQVSHAQRRDNIQYLVARAEDRALAAGTVDLVTVGQALHWIDAPDFYSVVRCVAKPGGLVAVWGYDWARVCPEIDALIVTLYAEILDGCWPPERRLVDEHYANVPFPQLPWHLVGRASLLGTQRDRPGCAYQA